MNPCQYIRERYYQSEYQLVMTWSLLYKQLVTTIQKGTVILMNTSFLRHTAPKMQTSSCQSKNSRTFMWVQIGQFNNLQNRLFYREKIRSLLVQKNCMHRKMIKSALKLNSYYLIEKYSNDFWLSIKPFNLVISVMVTLWFFNMS